MPSEDTQFSQNKQPKKRRGKSTKTLILDAIKEKALLECDTDTTKEEVEQKVFGFLAQSAFNPTSDTAVISNTCLSTLMKKGWPDMKASAPCVTFDFNKNTDKSSQADDIMNAVAMGKIAPDVGVQLITALGTVMKIKELDEFESRLKALEDNQDDEA